MPRPPTLSRLLSQNWRGHRGRPFASGIDYMYPSRRFEFHSFRRILFGSGPTADTVLLTDQSVNDWTI